jgi:phosphoenolpyruvate carboxylase
LASIPRSYDVASKFYSGEDIPPIFEVILPMTTSAVELIQISSYYERLTMANETLAPDSVGSQI